MSPDLNGRSRPRLGHYHAEHYRQCKGCGAVWLTEENYLSDYNQNADVLATDGGQLTDCHQCGRDFATTNAAPFTDGGFV